MEEKQLQLINTMETNHAREISVMKANQVTFQNGLEEMERLQIQKFQLRVDDEWERNKETNQKPPNPLNQGPSLYEEVMYSIEKWLIEGDLDKREINNKVDAHTVNPPVIEDQVITHGTSEIDPSSLAGQMQNEERHVTHILHTSCESFEVESSTSSVIQLAMKKKRKKKKMRKRFDALDGREQLDFRIGKSPTVCRIGHGTSEKQPTDLPESRQMLSIHYIEHI